jgi:hypothetical protein
MADQIYANPTQCHPYGLPTLPTYLQPSQPSQLYQGALWFNSSSSPYTLNRWNGLSFDPIPLSAVSNYNPPNLTGVNSLTTVSGNPFSVVLGSYGAAFSLNANSGQPTFNALSTTGVVTVSGGALSSSTLVNPSYLGSGFPSAGTFLRGDGTWQSVSGAGNVIGPVVSSINDLAVFGNTTGSLLADNNLNGSWGINSLGSVLTGAFSVSTTSVDGLLIGASNAATSVSPAWSPAIHWRGHYYSGSSKNVDWFSEVQAGYTYNSTAYNALVFSGSDNGGTRYSNLAVLDGVGGGAYSPTFFTPSVQNLAGNLSLLASGNLVLNPSSGQTQVSGNMYQTQNANSYHYVGQDSTHALSLGWAYNPNPSSANGVIATYSQNNLLQFQAKNFQFDTASLGSAVQMFADGRVRIGGGSDDNANALQVVGTLAVGSLSGVVSATSGVFSALALGANNTYLGVTSGALAFSSPTLTLTGDTTGTGVLSSSIATTTSKINGTSLSGLATGILKNTAGTGVPTIAISGTDYAPPTSGGSILYGNGSGGFSPVTVSTGLAFTGGVLTATGSGSITGPGTTAVHDLVTWNNGTGTLVTDPGGWSILSGVLIGNNAFQITNASTSIFCTVGQDATHSINFGWGNGTPASNGVATIATYGNANPIYYQALFHQFDTGVAAALQITNSGRIRVGGGADEGYAAFQIAGVTGVLHVNPNGGVNGTTVNTQSINYTLQLTDASNLLYHPGSDTTARTFTIPSNVATPIPVGTSIKVYNGIGAGVLTIAIATDTLAQVGSSTTGSFTLAAGHGCLLTKIASTLWIADIN